MTLGWGRGGGVDFVNGGGGRKTLKVFTVEVKVIFACFGHISIKIVLKTNREQSERGKIWEKLAFWVRPPDSASEFIINL